MDQHCVLPELSRSHMLQDYLANKKSQAQGPRKRKRQDCHSGDTDDGSDEKHSENVCFAVQDCDHGVGMIATSNISCGSLVISCEDALVSTRPFDDKLFCHYCITPLGNLRDHLKAPNDLVLPFLEGNGPCFSESVIECDECHQVAWCSKECSDKGRSRHQFLCSRGTNNPLEDFYDTVDNPSIFQLATDSLALILSAVVRNQDLMNIGQESGNALESIQKLYFWKDFGAHPLWWEVGSNEETTRQQRHRQCKEYLVVIGDWMFSQSEQHPLLLKDTSKSHRQTFVRNITAELCTLKYMGCLLGMLQCNVMEFSYPSPVGQYLDHIEHETQDEGGDDGEEDERNTASASVQKGREWLQNHSASLKDRGSSVTGSGLFPLLTLANHDCDPCASIDFLQESNRGSMVALRDIANGDPIHITYVPNGDLEPGGGPDRFRHCTPTRTWKWLNHSIPTEEDGDDTNDESTVSGEEEHEITSNTNDAMEDCHEDTDSTEEADNDDEAAAEEGADQKTRSEALLEYGFHCSCDRCSWEKANPSKPYERITREKK